MRKRAIAAVLGLVTAGAAPLRAQDQAAEVSRASMVFFGWGKPEIDRDAAAILDQVVATFAKNPASQLRIDGHSDRSGPAAPNRRTSLRRADAVRAYLAERGVPARAMATAGLGEDQPIIATADGVREPQNRRVEIHFAPRSAR